MSSATPPPIVEHDALAAGTRFGEFEIKRVHGVGGFGIVYLAWDHSLEREVALKEYMPATLASRGVGEKITVRSASYAETFAIGLRSFMNEARLLARFDHPSLVKVYRFWEDNATAYMVMPFLRGVTLRDTRRRMGHPPDEAWIRSVVLPILSALELLHREGVYHRDIAPDNILLPPDGPPILLDFGAARRVISDRTQSLTAILKPSYAPIEQYAEMAQLRQGPWTDLYALGAVVHYLLFGAPPAPATARAVQDETDAIEQRVVPGVTPLFMRTVAWMLAVRPNQRPQNAETLRAVLDGRAVPPAPGTTVVPTRPPLTAATAPAAESPAALEGNTRVQPPTTPRHERTAGLMPGAEARPGPGGAHGPAAAPPAAPRSMAPPLTSVTPPPSERTAGLAPILAGSGSFSPRGTTAVPATRSMAHDADADATRIEPIGTAPSRHPPTAQPGIVANGSTDAARTGPATQPPPRGPAVSSPVSPEFGSSPVSEMRGVSEPAPTDRSSSAPELSPSPTLPSRAPGMTRVPGTAQPPGTTQPPGVTQPPGTTQPPGVTQPPVTRPPDVTRPSGTTRPPGLTQPSGTTRPPGLTQPPGFEQSSGFTHRSGFSQPSGFTHPSGFTQPPGMTRPPGITQPPGRTLPPAAGMTQPPSSGFGQAPASRVGRRSPVPWIAGTAAAVVAAVAVGAWVAGRPGAETTAAEPAASAAAPAIAASGAAIDRSAVPARPPEAIPSSTVPTGTAAVVAPSVPPSPGTLPNGPALATATVVADPANAASAARVRPPRGASAALPLSQSDPSLTGASGYPRPEAASGPSAAERARAAQVAASARESARPPPAVVTDPAPATLAEACGSRQFIAKYRCEEDRCEEARFRNNPGCELILNRKRQRENR